MKKIIALTLLCAIIVTSLVTGCTVKNYSTITVEKYTGPYSETDGTYAGVDELDRTLREDVAVYDETRTVGIFYFLWIGTDVNGEESHSYGPIDNTVTLEKFRSEYPEGTFLSEAIWSKLGGGNQGEQSFWGKPLFDYYTSGETWVYRKHCQMLTDAGIDYIVFDVTNGQLFLNNVKRLISVWYEYLEQGVDVPKLAFYTHSGSQDAMYKLYTDLYTSSSLKSLYPRIDELWFRWPYDGQNKPLIIGDPDNSAKGKIIKDYFSVRSSVWPQYSPTDSETAFPWMEFGRLYQVSSVYGTEGQNVINVSVAQHTPSICFSSSWYNDPDTVNRTRSYRCFNIFDFDTWDSAAGYNDTAEDAYLYGYNFQDQWDFANNMGQEYFGEKSWINSIFVTGFNEWVAFRQAVTSYTPENVPVVYVDCADINNSRDIEPMEGGYGDNYLMQLIDNMRIFKGTANRVYVGDGTTVNIKGDFAQWEDKSVTAKYTDYKNDTVDRNSSGWGGAILTNTTGRNDFIQIKACRDTDKIYFYAETSEDVSFEGGNPISVFLDTDAESKINWEGYEYAVDITSANTAVLKKADGSDEWKWKTVADCEVKVEGNKIMLGVDRESIGMPETHGRQLVDLRFKWADNCFTDDTPTAMDFYKNGDAAPYGRLNYVFSEAPVKTDK